MTSSIDARSIVIPGESPEVLESLVREYHDHLQPEGPVERFLVDSLIHADWSRRRLTRLESQILQGDLPDEAKAATYTVIFKQINAMERQFHRAHDELVRLQRAPFRQETSPSPQPKPIRAEAARPVLAEYPQMGAIGFVPAISNSAIPGMRPLPKPVALGRLKNGEPIAVRR